VFRSLAHALGDSVFDRAVRDDIGLRRTGERTSHTELIAAMSRAAGRDMTAFIMPWLAGQYIPNVDARVDGQRVIVTQSQPDVMFELPLDLALTTASGAVVRRSMHLARRADTLNVADLGPVTGVRVDPDHHYLLHRHYGEVVRFALPAAAAPEAKTVELAGNFLAKPMAATRTADAWVVELPLSEGRYIWQWRVDGAAPNDEATLSAAAGPAAPGARAGIRVVKPLQRLAESYPR
jgi:hypothetical protein